MSTPGCTDYPPGWSDSDGDDCWSYEFNEFCTQSGGYGDQWDEAWGKFQSYTMDGYDASTACCACGGGSDTYQGYNDNECRDAEGWADSDGDTCTSYSMFFWCTPEGRPGEGWHEDWGSFTDFASGGVSAPEACCACGGGSEGSYEGTGTGTQNEFKPDDDTAGVEVPSGVAWAVASGPCKKDGDDCILSPNYPNNYGDDEKCVIGVNVDMIKPISAEMSSSTGPPPFSTEWGYDTLKINDQSYSGTLGPRHVKPLGAIVWSSDFDTHASGWRLCQEGDASDLPGDVALGGTSPTASPAPNLGTLDSQSKGMGMIVVLGVLIAVAGACWLKMRRSAPDSGIGEGMPRRMGTA